MIETCVEVVIQWFDIWKQTLSGFVTAKLQNNGKYLQDIVYAVKVHKCEAREYIYDVIELKITGIYNVNISLHRYTKPNGLRKHFSQLHLQRLCVRIIFPNLADKKIKHSMEGTRC